MNESINLYDSIGSKILTVPRPLWVISRPREALGYVRFTPKADIRQCGSDSRRAEGMRHCTDRADCA
jgi:hypothetical protein